MLIDVPGIPLIDGKVMAKRNQEHTEFAERMLGTPPNERADGNDFTLYPALSRIGTKRGGHWVNPFVPSTKVIPIDPNKDPRKRK